MTDSDCNWRAFPKSKCRVCEATSEKLSFNAYFPVHRADDVIIVSHVDLFEISGKTIYSRVIKSKNIINNNWTTITITIEYFSLSLYIFPLLSYIDLIL